MRRSFILHCTIFVAALVLRVGLTASFIGINAPPKGETDPDGTEYERFAYFLSIGEGFGSEPGNPTACRPPGPSFVLAPVYVIFGLSFLAARLWWCLLSAACCPVAGWLAQRVGGGIAR